MRATQFDRVREALERSARLVEEPAWVGLFDLERWMGTRNPATALLGVLEDGRPVLLDLRHPSTGHLMIEAPAGWGKSTLVRTAMVSACWRAGPSQLGLLAVDLSERELCIAEAIPHALAEVARDVAAAAELVAWLAAEARRRMESAEPHPQILLALDSFDWLGEPDQGPARANVQGLLEDGAAVGIHLIGAANSGLLDALAGRSLPRNVVIARAAPRGSVGEGKPRGTFVASAPRGPVRFQAACLSASDLNTAAQVLAGGRRRSGGSSDRHTANSSLSTERFAEWVKAWRVVPVAQQEVAR